MLLHMFPEAKVRCVKWHEVTSFWMVASVVSTSYRISVLWVICPLVFLLTPHMIYQHLMTWDPARWQHNALQHTIPCTDTFMSLAWTIPNMFLRRFLPLSPTWFSRFSGTLSISESYSIFVPQGASHHIPAVGRNRTSLNVRLKAQLDGQNHRRHLKWWLGMA